MVMIGQMQQRRCVGTRVGVIILAGKVSYSELVVVSHKPAVCLHDGGVLPLEIAMCQQASRHLSLSPLSLLYQLALGQNQTSQSVVFLRSRKKDQNIQGSGCVDPTTQDHMTISVHKICSQNS